MRPRGKHRSELTGFVSGGGRFTMRELAQGLGCTVDRVDDVVRRALDAGELLKAGTRRVPGAKRPVAEYAGASVCTEAPAVDLAKAIQVWGR